MYWITAVSLVIFSFSHCVDSAVSSVIADVCKAAGQKKVTVCSALGFNGASGNAVFESVFNEGFGEHVVIVRDELDIDVGSSDIAVAMVKIVELGGDLNNLIVNIQNIIEEAMRKGRPTKLLVILAGRDGNEKDKRRVMQLVDEVWSLLPKNPMQKNNLEDFLQVSVHGLVVTDGDAVSSVAAAVRAAVEATELGAGTGMLSGAQMASLLSVRAASRTKARTVSAKESRAAADCSDIAEDFLQRLRSRLSGGAALKTSSPSTNSVAQAVRESLAENHEKYSREFEQHALSDALRAASYRAHAGLNSILQPIYRKSATTVRTSYLRAFETIILNVAPNSRLVAGLRTKADAILSNYKLQANAMKSQYTMMGQGVIEVLSYKVVLPEDREAAVPQQTSEKTDAEPLVGEETEGNEDVASVPPPAVKVPVPTVEAVVAAPPPQNILNGPWSFSSKRGAETWGLGAELRSLLSGIAESSAERERFLFLSGAFNPYIRDMPIPPTKLSFNYLLDPAGLMYGRGYDKMYDEQSDGLAERRANPLQVPGLATIPFDPNDHPVPSDNTPWWRIIVDFYTGESDE